MKVFEVVNKIRASSTGPLTIHIYHAGTTEDIPMTMKELLDADITAYPFRARLESIRFSPEGFDIYGSIPR